MSVNKKDYIDCLSRMDEQELRDLFRAYLAQESKKEAKDAAKGDYWLPFTPEIQAQIESAKKIDGTGEKSWLAAIERLPHKLIRPSAPDGEFVRKARLIWASQLVGLEDIFERMLIQAMNYRSTGHARPLLLVGDPGCGKSTAAQVYAQLLGLPLYRISCPNLGDGGGLAGDRAVYRGSNMGAIMEGVCQTGCGNPLFVLDEIDKVSAQASGSNASFSSVLLNLLDGFSDKFRDTFLRVEADLSSAAFCLVANELEPLPAPLIDRCEVIRFPTPGRAQLTGIVEQFTLPNALKGVQGVEFAPGAAGLMVDGGWPLGMTSPRQYATLAFSLCGRASIRALEEGCAVVIGAAEIDRALREICPQKPRRPLGFCLEAG